MTLERIGPIKLIAVILAVGMLLSAGTLLAQYQEQQGTPTSIIPDDFSEAIEEPQAPITIQHYVLEAEFFPQTHELKGKAQIRFQARENVSSIELQLNNNLFPTNMADETGATLSGRRVGGSLEIDISLNEMLRSDEVATITFEYEGVLADAQYSPVDGVQLAYIGEEGSYLLYPARWFPVSGYTTNRYTAELHLKVPEGYVVVSGGDAQAPVTAEGSVQYSFAFPEPQFAGSIAIVRSSPEVVASDGRSMPVYFSPERQAMAQVYGEAAGKMVNFFSSKFGPPAAADFPIVEIDDNSLGGYAGSGIIFLSSRAIGTELNARLLAQEVAQQWWRGLVSPATRSDAWLDHGLATYSEALYLENVGGKPALESRMQEMSIDALTYDTVPVRGAGRLTEFSPEYKSVAYDKPGVVLHMLRWFLEDEKFFQALQAYASRFAYQAATTEDFRKVLQEISSQDLGPFFIQWMDSTGASDFQADYIVYRIKDGYKLVGEVKQDRDVFSMPVEIQVETVGEPSTERVLVTGKSTEFTITTKERPRKIVLDPNHRILKLNDEIRLKIAITRGEHAAQRRDYQAALEEYQKALDQDRISSLAHYRVGEVFFLMRNYQSAANAFRQAINGDLEPAWAEVWSHIYLGKIFDITGQRDRAINEYQQAIRTNDNTQGAVDEANTYLKEPYVRGG
ncbi:MAG: hypothetical protein A3F68_06190 [Acidobacteria bacterium RIFCSPLOWO2_12_FULL_54_10]|nr:MAG: hypothetical protein A3F68_06190 [Acidobacteria bacterium RIFCSPLOWO2_12_FULL_54_10]